MAPESGKHGKEHEGRTPPAGETDQKAIIIENLPIKICVFDEIP